MRFRQAFTICFSSECVQRITNRPMRTTYRSRFPDQTSTKSILEASICPLDSGLRSGNTLREPFSPCRVQTCWVRHSILAKCSHVFLTRFSKQLLIIMSDGTNSLSHCFERGNFFQKLLSLFDIHIPIPLLGQQLCQGYIFYLRQKTWVQMNENVQHARMILLPCLVGLDLDHYHH